MELVHTACCGLSEFINASGGKLADRVISVYAFGFRFDDRVSSYYRHCILIHVHA